MKRFAEALIVCPFALLILTSAIYASQPHGGSIETPVPGAAMISPWELGGAKEGFLQLSTDRPLDGAPSIQFGATFRKNATRVFIALPLKEPLNMVEENYLNFWIYASQDIANVSKTFSAQITYPFALGVTLTSQDEDNKTYGPYPISWRGWGQLALPLHYSGILAGQSPESLVYNGVSESQNWTDNISLKRIIQVRFDFIASSSAVTDAPHSLLLNSLRTSRHEYTGLEVVNSIISVFPLLTSIFIIPLYVTKYCRAGTASKPFRTIAGWISPAELPFKQATLFWIALVVKVIIAAITPLSSDFIDIARASTPVEPNFNPFTNSPAFGGFMTVLLYFMYRIWLLLPVDHINLLQIVPGSFYTPTPGAGVFHFPLSPGSFLLFLLLRTPNIVCDMSLAVIIYKFALRLSGSAKAAGSASAFWLINPFGTLIAEMWANFDIIFALFLTLGVYSLFRRRLFWSATFLALSVGVRFWSILLLPFVLSVLESEFHADRHPLLLSRNSLVFAASSIILSVVAISPFLISMLLGDAPRSIIYSDAPDVSFFLGLPLRLYDYIILPLIAALVIYLFILYDVWKPRFREIHIVILGFLLIFFALARWQGQWFLWALPFLALDFGTRRKGRKYATLFMVTILPLVIVQEGFYFSTWGNSFFFIPNFNPNLIALSRQLFLLLYDPGVITFRLPSLLESTLVGLSVAYFLGLYRDSRSQKVHPDGNSHEKT